MAKENEFYMQLINLALPPETNNHTEATERPSSRGMAFEILLYGTGNNQRLQIVGDIDQRS